MKSNPKLNVKIKLNPDPTSLSQRPLWLHVEWFKIGGCKPRKYVDQYWLTADESEATPVEPSRARRLAAEAKSLASFAGEGDMKPVYMAQAGRGWAPTALKKALAAEEAWRKEQVGAAMRRLRACRPAKTPGA